MREFAFHSLEGQGTELGSTPVNAENKARHIAGEYSQVTTEILGNICTR